MPLDVDTMSRRIAVGALLASAAFFAWWGLAMGRVFVGYAPFFLGLTLSWGIAAVGMHRARAWGPGYAGGLCALATVVMLPAGLHPPVVLFLCAQVVIMTALVMHAMATPAAPSAWRHTGLAFAAGLATPWLLYVGLVPGAGLAGALIGLAALALAGAGITAAFRGRTWGLLAMMGTIPLALAIPESPWSCHASPHDRAGDLAALALALAAIPWIGPIARHLRRA